MSAANKVRLASVVFVALALLPHEDVRATDERTFREASSQTTLVSKAQYVRQILVSAMSDEQKVQALKRVFRLGMSWKEVEDILGIPQAVVLAGSVEIVDYRFDPLGFTFIFGGAEGAIDIDYHTKTGQRLSIAAKRPN